MEPLEALIPLLGIICLFGLPVWTYHQRKMMELKLRLQGSADQNLVSEMRELRTQVAQLRDTTTQYDMSFDAALQRIESRVSTLETRVQTVESGASAVRS